MAGSAAGADLDGAAGQVGSTVAAYRRFLREPGVENEFHAVKALEQRLRSTARERQHLTEAAAAAEVDAGRLARASDEDGRRHLGFPTGTALAAGLVAADGVPAYLAAQAFGLDLSTTIGITVVLVAALATAMWATARYQSGWRRAAVAGTLGAGLLCVGALRFWYLFVTAGDMGAALLQAAGLTVFTTLLVWLGVVALGLTKTRHVSAAERHARSLRRQARRAAAQEVALRRRAELATREFIGRAQVFSTHVLAGDDARARFLDRVRSEVTT